MQHNALIQALLKPTSYPHPVDRIDLIETHISWVLLTGQYAYKIKKPVNFGFVDFTTLEKRRYYCEREITLNKRLAPEIYLSVTKITGTVAAPSLSQEGEALEYAVKMLQFSQSDLMSEQLQAGKVAFDDMTSIAEHIAAFHTNTATATYQSDYGSAEQIRSAMLHNFSLVKPALDDPSYLEMTEQVEAWSKQRYKELLPLFAKRKLHGFVRECHGDLHLGNITKYKQQWMAFDCIEFNDEFRWIDTMSEVAFLLMDLDMSGKRELGTHFLNSYLNTSGDFTGLSVLEHYKTYRAMVRAKVAALQIGELDETAPDRNILIPKLHAYIELAFSYTTRTRPCLFLMYGLSGSGKSWLAEKVSHKINAIWIRSDKERKRKFENKQDNLYSEDITQQVYNHLTELAEQVILAGHHVIIDATFLKRQHRESFYQLANKLQAPYRILHCHSQQKILESRIQQRSREINNISDADIAVLGLQTRSMEQLTREECQNAFSVDTAQENSISDLIDKTRSLCESLSAG